MFLFIEIVWLCYITGLCLFLKYLSCFESSTFPARGEGVVLVLVEITAVVVFHACSFCCSAIEGRDCDSNK